MAEFTIGIALVLGIFTRVAAWAAWPCSSPTSCPGPPRARVYALLAIVVLVMWKTSSWIGVDGVVANYRKHHPGEQHYLRIPRERDATGTVSAVKTAA